MSVNLEILQKTNNLLFSQEPKETELMKKKKKEKPKKSQSQNIHY
jgi:hypothetical protein